jgi:hypothetical protein
MTALTTSPRFSLAGDEPDYMKKYELSNHLDP